MTTGRTVDRERRERPISRALRRLRGDRAKPTVEQVFRRYMLRPCPGRLKYHPAPDASVRTCATQRRCLSHPSPTSAARRGAGSFQAGAPDPRRVDCKWSTPRLPRPPLPHLHVHFSCVHIQTPIRFTARESGMLDDVRASRKLGKRRGRQQTAPYRVVSS